MKMKTLLMALALAVTALTCASASAQFRSNSVQDHTSSRSHRNNTHSASDSPLSPLLGAPEDYEESYLSRLGNDAAEHAASPKAVTYRLTPDEQLLSPGLADRKISSSAETTSHSDVASPHVAREEHEAHKFQPSTTTLKPASASQMDSLGRPIDSDTVNTIYGAPW